MKKIAIWTLSIFMICVCSIWGMKQIVKYTTGISIRVSGSQGGKLRIYYDNLSQGPYFFEDQYSVIKDISEFDNKDVFIPIPKERMERIRLDYDFIDTVLIQNVQLRTGPICIYDLDAEHILQLFHSKNNVDTDIEGNSLILTATDNDPFLFSEKINIEHLEKSLQIYKIITSFWCAFILVALFKNFIAAQCNRLSTGELFGIVAVLLVCLPVVSYRVFGETSTRMAESNDYEKAPTLTIDTMESFSSEYEQYFNNHLPYKDFLIKANNFMYTKLLMTSSNRSVILGKKDWLFYDSKNSNDGDELSDYLGNNLYTETELEEAVSQVLNMYQLVSEKGIEFYLMIAPNKSTIYSEYMPGYLKKGQYSRVDQLVNELHKYPQINVVYVKDILNEYKEIYPLYYKFDTHWNDLGGYLGTQALLKKMGKDSPDIEDLTFQKEKCSNKDLAYMMDLEDFYNNDYYYKISNYKEEINVKEIKHEVVTQSDYNSFYESSSPDKRTLLFCRDSFGEATFHTLPSNFRNTIYIHRNLWTNDYLDTYQPDIFVFEFVERHSSILSSFLQADTKS